VAFEQPRHLHRQSRRARNNMSGRRDRIDADMRYKTPVLGGDQHPAVERVDPIWLDRQPPLAVPGQEAP
jgi:hypothetical protein